jgi:hypothetical protein
MSKSDTNPQNNQPVHVTTPVVFSSDGSQTLALGAGTPIVTTGTAENKTVHGTTAQGVLIHVPA